MPVQSHSAQEHYQLVRRLAHDADGELWEARVQLPEGHQRPCLVRLSGPDTDADELLRRRFGRQAMLAHDVSVEHRNLLTLRRFGTWHDGRLFLAMDWARGETVADRKMSLLRDGGQIGAIARGVLGALAHLHGVGVAYGSVTADSITIGDDGAVLLCAFDRATPNAQGRQLRADLSALGALLFTLAVGVTPGHDEASWATALAVAGLAPSLAEVIIGLLAERFSAAEALAILDGSAGARVADGAQRASAGEPRWASAGADGDAEDAGFDAAALVSELFADADDIDDDAAAGVYGAVAAGLVRYGEALIERSRVAADSVLRPLLRPLRWMLLLALAATAGVAFLAYDAFEQQRQRPDRPAETREPALVVTANPDEPAVASEPAALPPAITLAPQPAPPTELAQSRAPRRAAVVSVSKPRIRSSAAALPADPEDRSTADIDYARRRVQPRWHTEDQRFERTARSSDGIQLIARDAVILDELLIVRIIVSNDSETPFHAATAQVASREGTIRIMSELEFRVIPAAGCWEGFVAPGGRCRGMLRVQKPNRFGGASISITVSDADDARRVAVEDLSW